MGAAFAGLGLVLEFVAHRVLELAEPLCEIAVELTAEEAGPGSHGREVISIDLSEYGDPLYTRSIRLFKVTIGNLQAMCFLPLIDLPIATSAGDAQFALVHLKLDVIWIYSSQIKLQQPSVLATVDVDSRLPHRTPMLAWHCWQHEEFDKPNAVF